MPNNCSGCEQDSGAVSTLTNRVSLGPRIASVSFCTACRQVVAQEHCDSYFTHRMSVAELDTIVREMQKLLSVAQKDGVKTSQSQIISTGL